jgi:hypothetical protein
MRIELFSTNPADGQANWIDVREAIKGGDIFAVREAAVVPLDDEGRAAAMSFQAMDDAQFIALFHRVVTAWSFPAPLPIPSAAAARSLLSDLEADDMKKVRAEMKPLLDKVKDDSLPDSKSGGASADAVDDRPAPEAEG